MPTALAVLDVIAERLLHWAKQTQGVDPAQQAGSRQALCLRSMLPLQL